MAVIAMTMVLFSCSNDNDDNVKPLDSEPYIEWGLSMGRYNDGTRASIFSNEGLQLSCESNNTFDGKDDTSERIGILADLLYKPDYTQKQEQYFNHLLCYNYNGSKNWQYYEEGDNPETTFKKPWIRGTKLSCTAYYPARYLRNEQYTGAQITKGTTAEKMSLYYSAVLCQEDLMVGFNVIDADKRTDKDGEKLEKKNVVPLEMTHALSSLKFVFSSPATICDDYLTSVCLDDTGTEDNPDYFAVVGSLTYNTEKTTDNKYKKSLTWERKRSFIYENYVWKNDNGIEINHENGSTATPYQGENYTNHEAKLYSQNEGYILIIPQNIPEDLYLCFTTKNGGKIKKKLKGIGGIFEWKYNTRYTYNISLSAPEITLTVDVTDWNNIDSNISIDINE